MIPPSWIAGAAGWASAGVLGLMLLGAREDVGRQQELCNRQKLASVAEAQQIAREAEREAAQATLTRVRELYEMAEKGRQRALESAREAESRPAEVREVIRRVTDPESCLNQPVPAGVLDRLRATGGDR